MQYRTQIFAVAALCAAISNAFAAPEWRVVLTPSSNVITLPNLPPPGTYDVGLPGPVISDSAAATLNFPLRLSNGNYDLWRESAGVLNPYAQIGATDLTGPGRVGAEAGHVFRRLVDASTTLVDTDTNAQDARVFAAFAGDPGVALDAASIGAWIASATGNAEFARRGVEGVLGPNIGAGWSFGSDGGPNIFGRLHALPNGAVLINTGARFTGTPNLAYTVLARHQPGMGNTTCSVTQATNAAWAPGVLGNDYFESIRYASSSPQGEVYAAGDIARQMPIAVRNGIWQFCAGAPQVKVLSDSIGALGPNIPGNSNAVFTRIPPNIGPSTQGSFYFGGENAVAATAFKGVFHHSFGQNRAILLNDVEGALGPQIPGFVFDTVLDYNPISAGQYAIVRANIRPVGGTSLTTGLWRLRPNAAPEPVAIIGNTGAFVPAPNRVWRDLDLFSILENGDVLLQANTSNAPAPDAISLWRIRPGRPPEEVLKRGDLVRIPTAAGVVLRPLRGIFRPGAGNPALRLHGGDDSWLSASGNVLINIDVDATPGVFISPWVRAQVSDLDVLLRDGFEF